MIIKLDNSSKAVAAEIYKVFQNSYKVEAKLIGVIDFPPLLRSAEHIAKSTTDFYGYIEHDCLAGVIEVVIKDKHLDIHSLTVDPSYFRKGVANQLMTYVTETFDFYGAKVETAVVNLPAINLYKKYGFVEYKRWIPPHGIEKIALSLSCSLTKNI
jgi:ribosomal protein S18 acetylase RimI-like enzyme